LFSLFQELKKVERQLANLGEKLSKPFFVRAKELIVELSKFKGVKINYLLMGMGGWTLDAEFPYEEHWSGGIEKGVHEFSFHDIGGRSCWAECYENVNPGIVAVARELDNILEILTNEQYLQIFDIDKDEMKKLLKT